MGNGWHAGLRSLRGVVTLDTHTCEEAISVDLPPGDRLSAQFLIHEWHSQAAVHALRLPPRILILRFSRYTDGPSGAAKNHAFITWPRILQMPMFTGDSMESANCAYSVEAATLHRGLSLPQVITLLCCLRPTPFSFVMTLALALKYPSPFQQMFYCLNYRTLRTHTVAADSYISDWNVPSAELRLVFDLAAVPSDLWRSPAPPSVLSAESKAYALLHLGYATFEDIEALPDNLPDHQHAKRRKQQCEVGHPRQCSFSASPSRIALAFSATPRCSL